MLGIDYTITDQGWVVARIESEHYRLDPKPFISMRAALMTHFAQDFTAADEKDRREVSDSFLKWFEENKDRLKIPEELTAKLEEALEETPKKFVFETEQDGILSYIKGKLHPITLHEKSESMLFFDRGIFRFNAETRIKEICQKIIDACNTGKVNSILDTVRRSSYIERELLGVESNPHLVLQESLFNIDQRIEEPYDVCLKRNYYFLNRLKVKYVENATCPNFLKFINHALPEQDVILVQEILGAILRKWYFTKKMAVFTGPPNTGKTTLLSVFIALLGQENVSSIPIQRLGKGDKFTLGPMFGKMANIADDMPKDSVRSIGVLKQLTGLSIMQAERKFGEEFNFVNYAFLLFACNDLPPIQEDDEAFWDRMIQVDFNNVVPKSEINRNLLAELTTPEELSGILNWGLEGLYRLEKNGWNFSRNETKEKARERYRRRSEPLEAFVNEMIENTGEDSDFITKDEFFSKFKSYCDKNNIEPWVKDRIGKFLPAIPNLDVESSRASINNRVYRVWRRVKFKEQQVDSTLEVMGTTPAPVHATSEHEGPHEENQHVQVTEKPALLPKVDSTSNELFTCDKCAKFFPTEGGLKLHNKEMGHDDFY